MNSDKTMNLRRAAAIIGAVVVAVALAAIPAGAAGKVVRLSYVDWSETVAATNMVKAVLEEKMGYRCDIVPMTADKMWYSVADGEVDGMVAAWLPSTHGHYYDEVKDRVVDLGPNLKGTRIGLVVPNITVGRQTAASGQRNQPYIKADSIPELKDYADKFNYKIIGIDHEAGIMKKARQAMDVYGLDQFRLVDGSEVSMTAELSNAVRKQRWVVVTGWIPHWMFARWSLKFLKDPEGVFGGEEQIHTVVRKGLKEDMPEVHAFLDKFFWKPGELEQLMIWIKEDDGLYPYDKALRYMRYHPDQIQSWVK